MLELLLASMGGLVLITSNVYIEAAAAAAENRSGKVGEKDNKIKDGILNWLRW